jgi:hypothetical protein
LIFSSQPKTAYINQKRRNEFQKTTGKLKQTKEEKKDLIKIKRTKLAPSKSK